MKIFYLRDAKGFPVTCVASKIVHHTGGPIMVYFDFATHNPADRFSRAKARNTAAGRLEKHARYAVYLNPKKGETRRAIVEEIAKLADSQAAREAAYLWLQGVNRITPLQIAAFGVLFHLPAVKALVAASPADKEAVERVEALCKSTSTDVLL